MKGGFSLKSLYSDITSSEYETLDWVLHNDGRFPSDRFFDDPTIDGRISELESHGLISLDSNTGLHITELGRAAIVEYNIFRSANRKRLFWEIIRFIIPVIISVIALIVSILK